MNELPTLNRNLTSLQLLLPGSQKMHWQHASSENPQGGIQINNNGQDFGSTNFTIDGMDNNDPVLGIVVVNPAIDSVGEFKYTTGNFDAEFAQAGGAVIQVVTKSGAKQLHGSAFEFLQNDIMNARDPFSQPTGPAATALEPVRRLARRTRQERQAVLFWRLSGYAAQNGGFPAHHRPFCTSAKRRLQQLQCTDFRSGDGRRRMERDARRFPNNQIPSTVSSTPARNLLALLPAPNFGSPDLEQNNFTASGSESFDSDQFDIKADHYVTDKWKYFIRYSYADFEKIRRQHSA